MGGMSAAEAIRQAQQLADTVLYPSAMDVDAADRVPRSHLDALAAAGLYGIAGPACYGGMNVDLATFCSVIQIMAGSCLATTFVWLQHHGVVRALAAAQNEDLRSAWLGPLCRGQRRAGIALGGARPGPALLRARPAAGGYLLDGTAPWVTGWGMVDAIYTLARDEAGQLVAGLLPATDGEHLAARRLRLVAVNASCTVELDFTGYFVPEQLVCSVFPQREWLARDAQGLRANGSLALGVATRCCELIGAGPLDRELARLRDRLDAADTDAMPAARAAAAAFAFRAAGAAVAATGSRAIMAGQHPQRLAREALFLLVFGSRPAIKEHLAAMLAAPASGPADHGAGSSSLAHQIPSSQ
jgi:alkylation response protein AidB-like acyl-CoA dehydrogenase